MTLTERVKQLEAEVKELKSQLLALALRSNIFYVPAPAPPMPAVGTPMPIPYSPNIEPWQNPHPTITCGPLNITGDTQGLQ